MEKRKEKSELEWRKYWKEKAEKLQKENLMLKHKLKLAQTELEILRPYETTEQPKRKCPYWKGIRDIV